jgi:glycosyltransferase involved in cell wall biosynthesis/ribosomal protein S18 acetylase RimI-like enzyme
VSRPIRIAHLTTVDLSLRYLLLGQLRAMRDTGFEVATISAPGPWTAGLEAEGIRHIPWRNATRAWDPRADVRALRELVGLLRRERFDLVHTHNPKPGVLGRAAARLAGVPCVLNTVHGLYATPDDPLGKRLAVLGVERAAAGLSDLELYQSAEDLAWARRAGVVSPARSVLLGNGVDLTRFDPARVPAQRRAELRRQLDLPEDAIVVATVGRLVVEKGYRELFAAAASVRAARDDVRFLAIGDIDRDKADAIDERELTDARAAVTFTGWRQDVRDLLAAADVFALPSWREGMPRSAIEAAAMGRPLVLTNVRGCREVARDGIEGVLVPPRDPAGLAAAVEAVAADPALRERLGAAARARALERFDERRVAVRVIEAYRELLDRKGLSPRAGVSLHLRRARAEDATSLARLHRESLPGSFLPTLGDRFLRRMYRALADDRGAVALVAEQDGDVLGFATGVVSGRGFSWRFYRRHAIPALPTLLPRLVHTDVSRRVLESARHAARPDRPTLPDPELVSIAVAAEARGRGIGRSLAGEVVSGLEDLGASEVKVVVGADNAPGNDLYARMGFRYRTRIALHDGAPSNVWVIECRT